MIRNDGKYTIYCIQHYSEGWFYSNLDVFGYPKGFGADGICWQRTNIKGTFDKEEAESGLKELQEKHPNYKFRLVEIKIKQKTKVI